MYIHFMWELEATINFAHHCENEITCTRSAASVLQCLAHFCVCPQDLDAYATMYAGMAKLLRLLHIANRCRSLRVDALRLALSHVQTTHNVSMYRKIHSELVEAINKYVILQSVHSSCKINLLIWGVLPVSSVWIKCYVIFLVVHDSYSYLLVVWAWCGAVGSGAS